MAENLAEKMHFLLSNSAMDRLDLEQFFSIHSLRGCGTRVGACGKRIESAAQSVAAPKHPRKPAE
jgi:hypothetical protein